MSYREQQHSSITAIVDVSNVARDAQLPGCGADACWDRVEAVQRAWAELSGSEGGILLIADASLVHHLGSHCRQTFQRLRTAQDVLVHDLADTEILHIAEVTGAAVITRDYFKDHRLDFSWIQGNTDRFFAWRSAGGGLRLEARDMGVATEFTMSRHKEAGELKSSGIDVRSGRNLEAARHKYRCNTPRCIWHQWNADVLLAIPKVGSDHVARCPGCGEVVEDLGVSDRLVEVKLRGESDTVVRVKIAPGTPLVIGRDGDVAGDIKRLLGDHAAKISRHHAELRWDGSNLTVKDLGSTNGTYLERWSAESRQHGAPQRIEDEEVIRDRDRVRIGSILTISRSGRRYHRDETSDLRRGHDTARTVVPNNGPPVE